jgi:hypothetical protein
MLHRNRAAVKGAGRLPGFCAWRIFKHFWQEGQSDDPPRRRPVHNYMTRRDIPFANRLSQDLCWTAGALLTDAGMSPMARDNAPDDRCPLPDGASPGKAKR